MDVPTLESLNLIVTWPAVGLGLWACVLLLLDLFVPKEDKFATAFLAEVAVILCFALNFRLFRLKPERMEAFGGMYVADGFTTFVNMVVLVAVFIGILLSFEYLRRAGIQRGEYYPLLLISAGGAMLMAAGRDLVILFVGLELLSIPLYIMAGLRHRTSRASEESAIKYFLLGAFSSAFLVYGVALIYGATGSTNIGEIAGAVKAGVLASGAPLDSLLLALGAGMVLVGLGFKIAVAPFHMWTPDVYQGAPTSVTAYMSVVAKVGGFAGLVRLFATAFPAIGGVAYWQTGAAVLAGLTMIVGNVAALAQSDIKRMLAYSSIAHAGYLMMGVAASATPVVREDAVNAALFYLLAYAFTNLGAFAVAIAVERDDGAGTRIDDFAGLGKTRPFLALAMALFMFSLTGIPPTAGMVGKFLLFRAAVQADLVWLALVGLVTSLFSAFYYVRVIVKMYLEEGAAQAQPVRSYLGAAVALAALGTFIFGLLPFDPASLVQGVMLLVGG
ncbi:MAG: NADH-quinone oxidoreductase subunit N [Anaerolineae bacterium]|nr:NADH-quinone oxidoreductase subunit N [Anaerolineae bacterium]